jgi:membrane-associated protease RseP (regulator of RpoE activity)
MEPNPTPYDLHFNLFGISVRVHPMFWLMAAILGWGNMRAGFSYLFMWIGCVFLSILIHEMGHVVVGNIFGSRGHIVLYGFGGLAIGSNRLNNRWQRVAVSFAGPFAQFLLLGVAVGAMFLYSEPDRPFMAQFAVAEPIVRILFFLMIINFYWPILNLLPIWPLDGGMISREILDWLSPREGIRTSLVVSAVVAGGLAVLSLVETVGRIPLNIPFYIAIFIGGMWMTIFYALFAISSIQLLQQLPPSHGRYRDDDDQLPWERQRPEPWERERDRW